MNGSAMKKNKKMRQKQRKKSSFHKRKHEFGGTPSASLTLMPFSLQTSLSQDSHAESLLQDSSVLLAEEMQRKAAEERSFEVGKGEGGTTRRSNKHGRNRLRQRHGQDGLSEKYGSYNSYWGSEHAQGVRIQLSGQGFRSITQMRKDVRDAQMISMMDLSQNYLSYLHPCLQLRNLYSLSLRSNRFTEFGPLKHEMSLLKVLDLGGNAIAEFPAAETLLQLPSLQQLYLASNAIAQIDTAALVALSDIGTLEVLDLSNNSIAFLPAEVGRLTTLRSLNLSNNNLVELPIQIVSLTHLYASQESLDVRYNRLVNPPQEIAQRKGLLSIAEHFKMARRRYVFPPRAIAHAFFRENKDREKLQMAADAGMGMEKGDAEMGTFEGEDRAQHLKMILIGHEGAGKSSVVKALVRFVNRIDSYQKQRLPQEDVPQHSRDLRSQNHSAGGRAAGASGSMPESETDLYSSCSLSIAPSVLAALRRPSTTPAPAFLPGPAPEQEEPGSWRTRNEAATPLNALPTEPPQQGLTINVWDFAGKEIYHSAHELFFSEFALQLLVWDIRKSDTLHHFDTFVQFWVDLVQARAPGATILIVASHADELLLQHKWEDRAGGSTECWEGISGKGTAGGQVQDHRGHTDMGMDSRLVRERIAALQARLRDNERMRQADLHRDLLQLDDLARGGDEEEKAEKRRTIERLRECRPSIHPVVVPFYYASEETAAHSIRALLAEIAFLATPTPSVPYPFNIVNIEVPVDYEIVKFHIEELRSRHGKNFCTIRELADGVRIFERKERQYKRKQLMKLRDKQLQQQLERRDMRGDKPGIKAAAGADGACDQEDLCGEECESESDDECDTRTENAVLYWAMVGEIIWFPGMHASQPKSVFYSRKGAARRQRNGTGAALLSSGGVLGVAVQGGGNSSPSLPALRSSTQPSRTLSLGGPISVDPVHVDLSSNAVSDGGATVGLRDGLSVPAVGAKLSICEPGLVIEGVSPQVTGAGRRRSRGMSDEFFSTDSTGFEQHSALLEVLVPVHQLVGGERDEQCTPADALHVRETLRSDALSKQRLSAVCDGIASHATRSLTGSSRNSSIGSVRRQRHELKDCVDTEEVTTHSFLCLQDSSGSTISANAASREVALQHSTEEIRAGGHREVGVGVELEEDRADREENDDHSRSTDMDSDFRHRLPRDEYSISNGSLSPMSPAGFGASSLSAGLPLDARSSSASRLRALANALPAAAWHGQDSMADPAVLLPRARGHSWDAVGVGIAVHDGTLHKGLPDHALLHTGTAFCSRSLDASRAPAPVAAPSVHPDVDHMVGSRDSRGVRGRARAGKIGKGRRARSREEHLERPRRADRRQAQDRALNDLLDSDSEADFISASGSDEHFKRADGHRSDAGAGAVAGVDIGGDEQIDRIPKHAGYQEFERNLAPETRSGGRGEELLALLLPGRSATKRDSSGRAQSLAESSVGSQDGSAAGSDGGSIWRSVDGEEVVDEEAEAGAFRGQLSLRDSVEDSEGRQEYTLLKEWDVQSALTSRQPSLNVLLQTRPPTGRQQMRSSAVSEADSSNTASSNTSFSFSAWNASELSSPGKGGRSQQVGGALAQRLERGLREDIAVGKENTVEEEDGAGSVRNRLKQSGYGAERKNGKKGRKWGRAGERGHEEEFLSSLVFLNPNWLKESLKGVMDNDILKIIEERRRISATEQLHRLFGRDWDSEEHFNGVVLWELIRELLVEHSAALSELKEKDAARVEQLIHMEHAHAQALAQARKLERKHAAHTPRQSQARAHVELNSRSIASHDLSHRHGHIHEQGQGQRLSAKSRSRRSKEMRAREEVLASSELEYTLSILKEVLKRLNILIPIEGYSTRSSSQPRPLPHIDEDAGRLFGGAENRAHGSSRSNSISDSLADSQNNTWNTPSQSSGHSNSSRAVPPPVTPESFNHAFSPAGDSAVGTPTSAPFESYNPSSLTHSLPKDSQSVTTVEALNRANSIVSLPVSTREYYLLPALLSDPQPHPHLHLLAQGQGQGHSQGYTVGKSGFEQAQNISRSSLDPPQDQLDQLLLPPVCTPLSATVAGMGIADFAHEDSVRLERRFSFSRFVPAGLVPRIIARMYSRYCGRTQGGLDTAGGGDARQRTNVGRELESDHETIRFSEKNKCWRSTFVQEYGACTVWVTLGEEDRHQLEMLSKRRAPIEEEEEELAMMYSSPQGGQKEEDEDLDSAQDSPTSFSDGMKDAQRELADNGMTLLCEESEQISFCTPRHVGFRAFREAFVEPQLSSSSLCSRVIFARESDGNVDKDFRPLHRADYYEAKDRSDETLRNLGDLSFSEHLFQRDDQHAIEPSQSEQLIWVSEPSRSISAGTPDIPQHSGAHGIVLEVDTTAAGDAGARAGTAESERQPEDEVEDGDVHASSRVVQLRIVSFAHLLHASAAVQSLDHYSAVVEEILGEYRGLGPQLSTVTLCPVCLMKQLPESECGRIPCEVEYLLSQRLAEIIQNCEMNCAESSDDDDEEGEEEEDDDDDSSSSADEASGVGGNGDDGDDSSEVDTLIDSICATSHSKEGEGEGGVGKAGRKGRGMSSGDLRIDVRSADDRSVPSLTSKRSKTSKASRTSGASRNSRTSRSSVNSKSRQTEDDSVDEYLSTALLEAYLQWDDECRVICPRNGCNIKADLLVQIPPRIASLISPQQNYFALSKYLTEDVINPSPLYMSMNPSGTSSGGIPDSYRGEDLYALLDSPAPFIDDAAVTGGAGWTVEQKEGERRRDRGERAGGSKGASLFSRSASSSPTGSPSINLDLSESHTANHSFGLSASEKTIVSHSSKSGSSAGNDNERSDSNSETEDTASESESGSSCGSSEGSVPEKPSLRRGLSDPEVLGNTREAVARALLTVRPIHVTRRQAALLEELSQLSDHPIISPPSTLPALPIKPALPEWELEVTGGDILSGVMVEMDGDSCLECKKEKGSTQPSGTGEVCWCRCLGWRAGVLTSCVHTAASNHAGMDGRIYANEPYFLVGYPEKWHYVAKLSIVSTPIPAVSLQPPAPPAVPALARRPPCPSLSAAELSVAEGKEEVKVGEGYVEEFRWRVSGWADPAPITTLATSPVRSPARGSIPTPPTHGLEPLEGLLTPAHSEERTGADVGTVADRSDAVLLKLIVAVVDSRPCGGEAGSNHFPHPHDAQQAAGLGMGVGVAAGAVSSRLSIRIIKPDQSVRPAPANHPALSTAASRATAEVAGAVRQQIQQPSYYPSQSSGGTFAPSLALLPGDFDVLTGYPFARLPLCTNEETVNAAEYAGRVGCPLIYPLSRKRVHRTHSELLVEQIVQVWGYSESGRQNGGNWARIVRRFSSEHRTTEPRSDSRTSASSPTSSVVIPAQSTAATAQSGERENDSSRGERVETFATVSDSRFGARSACRGVGEERAEFCLLSLYSDLNLVGGPVLDVNYRVVGVLSSFLYKNGTQSAYLAATIHHILDAACPC